MTEPSASVVFETPPTKRRYDWAAIAEQLRSQPGEWAKVFDWDRQSLAVAIRVKGIKALHPDHGFEVLTRNNKVIDGTRYCTMYLRYNPDKDSEQD